ncbi:MAG: hypothetical protein JW918_18085, partial [Anaerolineae bacterium]|nr:hypothetical protein [Anaerolineae bacterium]
IERGFLVKPDVEGAYTRLQEPPAGPRPPVPPIRLRGRATDQVVVQSKLLSGHPAVGASPLVTLHGFGGVGKTALITAVAYWCWERTIFPGGVYFIRLPGTSAESEILVDHILRALGLSVPDPGADGGERYRARVAALCDALEGDACLLAIDNFEAVCEGANRDSDLALVAELRECCPKLHILIARRSGPLGFAGEMPYEVKPLAAKAAVELFRDRALDGGKMLLYAERTIAAEICELLDRVPLHIRMVSTRMRSDESPAAILDGLRDGERRYPVAADAPPHHRSRELAFRYVYDHLDEHGQRLWAVMAGVFAGAPGRADVRAVYAHFKADLSLDALLLWSVVEGVDGHHHMFEAAREFGRARLAEGALGEEEHDFRARHAAYYLSYAKEHRDDCDAPSQELPDILAGFAFFAAQATLDEDRMRKYVGAVDEFLEAHGYWLQKRRWRQEIE